MNDAPRWIVHPKRDESAIDYHSQMAPAAYRNSAAPTVLLFGWFGCRDQYLAKYSGLYTNKGSVPACRSFNLTDCSCQTVRFTATQKHAANLPNVARRFYNDVFVGELDVQAHSSFIVRYKLCTLCNACSVHRFMYSPTTAHACSIIC